MKKRDARFEMRCTQEELRKLNQLAEVYGVSAADVVRLLVRRESLKLSTGLLPGFEAFKEKFKG